MTMLKYCMIVLSAVTFDKRLYLKEYRKSLRWLDESDRVHLKRWAKENYVSL